jgi:hypothetical protein
VLSTQHRCDIDCDHQATLPHAVPVFTLRMDTREVDVWSEAVRSVVGFARDTAAVEAARAGNMPFPPATHLVLAPGRFFRTSRCDTASRYAKANRVSPAYTVVP